MILAIETSCDDSCVALMEPETCCLVDHRVGKIQVGHGKFGGVVPEIAGRGHLEALPKLVQETLQANKLGCNQLSAVAATASPGLVGSLLIGVSCAKAIAWGSGIPLVAVDHLEGHLLSPFLDYPEITYPFLGLIVSGGHTHLLAAEAFGRYKLLGKTMDDALGEAYDKVAKLLGFTYPGGVVIDALASRPEAVDSVDLPIPLLGKKTMNFSYSGLKTAVRNYAVQHELAAHEDSPLISYQDFCDGTDRASDRGQGIANLARSFQRVAAESLRIRIVQAMEHTGIDRVLLSGGVACNSGIRAMLQAVSQQHNCQVYYPQPKFCTDNAAMIAYVAAQRLAAGAPIPNLDQITVSAQTSITASAPTTNRA